jgi:hypothetical protein
MTHDAVVFMVYARLFWILAFFVLTYCLLFRVMTRQAYKILRRKADKVLSAATAVLAGCALLGAQLAMILGSGSFSTFQQVAVWVWCGHVMVANILAAAELRRDPGSTLGT